MHTRPLLHSALTLCSLLGASFLAPIVRAQNNPTLQYHVAEIVPKLLDEVQQSTDFYNPADSALMPTAVNSQGYILFAYRGASDAYYDNSPLVYLGNGKTVLLPVTGLSIAPARQGSANPRFADLVLSDVAADGSFRVAASYPSQDADGATRLRPVAWQVDASGNPSNPQPLQNLVLPPDSSVPGEQASAYPVGINSAGKVVGEGNSYLATLPLVWNLPGTTATREPAPAIQAFAVDESGNIAGSSAESGDAYASPSLNSARIPLPAPAGINYPQGYAATVNNGFAAGIYYPHYNPNDLANSNAATLGFVYKDGVAQTLPCYQDPNPSSNRPTIVEVYHINGQGDAIGNDGFVPAGYNVTKDVLWKRQTDGSYLEYHFTDLAITQPYDYTRALHFESPTNVWITADGSLIVTGVSQDDPSATHGGYGGLTVILKTGAGTTHPAFFSGEAALGNGVYYLSFPSGNYFGYYSYLDDPKYIYHFDMGYEYLFDANDGSSGIYLYDFKSSTFFYTSRDFPFPYLYDFTLNTFLYYYPDPNNAGHYNTDGYRFFYRFDTGKIIVK